MKVTINIMSNQDPHLINVTLITCIVISPLLQSSLFHTWAMEFNKTLKRPWDLSLVSNIIGIHSFSSHTLQAQLCLCSKDDFCYTCNVNQTQNFKYHKTNTILIIHSPPTWYYLPCLQFPTLISSGPLSHISGHRKTLPYRNQPICRCQHSLMQLHFNSKLQQSSLPVVFITFEDVTVLFWFLDRAFSII